MGVRSALLTSRTLSEASHFEPGRSWINRTELPHACRIRFAAVRLRSADGLQQLVQRGFEYGQRMHRQGVWAAWLGALPPHRAAT